MLECLDRFVLASVRSGREPEVHEEAVGAVDRGRPERLAVDRDQPLPLLARRFGKELLEPRPEVVDRRRRDQRDLVATVRREDAQDDAEDGAGIILHGHVRSARVRHLLCPPEEPRHVEAHDRGRDHAEVGERRVAPADRWQAEEDLAEPVGLGDLLEPRARIGDRDESAARALRPDDLPGALEEVLLEDVRLERAPGLRRDDEERLRDVHLPLERPDLGGIGGVEHEHLGESVDPAERLLQHLGAEARASHAEQERPREALTRDVVGHAAEAVDAARLVLGDPEPAEPARFVGARPEAGVARPEATHFPRCRPLLERLPHALLEIGGQRPCLAVHRYRPWMSPGSCSSMRGADVPTVTATRAAESARSRRSRRRPGRCPRSRGRAPCPRRRGLRGSRARARAGPRSVPPRSPG